jgi:glycerol-3-phosphate O-acyltransferase
VSLPAVAAICVATLATAVVARITLRRRVERWARALRRERLRIDRYKFTRKTRVVAALLEDPVVARAVEEHVRATGESESRARERVLEYAEEIVPSFNLLSYYRLGYGLARLLLPLLYKVSVGYEARTALDSIPRDSVVLYLMNHRSNADYVLVAYVLSGDVAISYAVGEWARVWPLETVFRRFGSYFVRRNCREALYHKVLERYVQLITRNGVTQGVFIEGGLTRDGRFRDPKLGILDHVVGVKRDPAFTRPLHIIPVALNYDRVLEDRSLLRELQSPEERLPRGKQIVEVSSYLAKVSLRFLLRRARRYGRACVNFGPPLDVDAWLAARPGVLDLPREERLPRLKELADDVMARIAAIMPATAVALACAALQQEGGERISRERWIALLDEIRETLRARDAHIVGDERSSSEILERALVMLTMRRVVTAEDVAFRIDRTHEPLLRFYANSIGHFLEPPRA